LSFCTFSFGHCVVCSSSIYGFWLPLWHLQTLLIYFVKIWVNCINKWITVNWPIKPPGTAYWRSFCSANNDRILDLIGLHVNLPSWSLDTIPGRTSISWPTYNTTITLIIIRRRNGTKTISLQTLFGRLQKES